MTLKDIAREANVSVSTVSRVLNSKGSLKDKESYKKIWEIVKREHYIPNKAAQGDTADDFLLTREDADRDRRPLLPADGQEH